jgi:hypothetical protein
MVWIVCVTPSPLQVHTKLPSGRTDINIDHFSKFGPVGRERVYITLYGGPMTEVAPQPGVYDELLKVLKVPHCAIFVNRPGENVARRGFALAGDLADLGDLNEYFQRHKEISSKAEFVYWLAGLIKKLVATLTPSIATGMAST